MIKIIVDYLTSSREGGRYKLYLPQQFGTTIFDNKVGEYIVSEFADSVGEWFDIWQRPINYSTDHIPQETKYFGRRGKGIRRLTLMADETKVEQALNKFKELVQ